MNNLYGYCCYEAINTVTQTKLSSLATDSTNNNTVSIITDLDRSCHITFNCKNDGVNLRNKSNYRIRMKWSFKYTLPPEYPM